MARQDHPTLATISADAPREQSAGASRHGGDPIPRVLGLSNSPKIETTKRDRLSKKISSLVVGISWWKNCARPTNRLRARLGQSRPLWGHVELAPRHPQSQFPNSLILYSSILLFFYSSNPLISNHSPHKPHQLLQSFFNWFEIDKFIRRMRAAAGGDSQHERGIAFAQRDVCVC